MNGKFNDDECRTIDYRLHFLIRRIDPSRMNESF